MALSLARPSAARRLQGPPIRPARTSKASQSTHSRLTARAEPEAAKPQPEEPQGSVSELAEQLMKDPESQKRLARVTEAAQRVAELQAESERLAVEMAAAAAEQAVSSEAAERRGAQAAAAIMAEAEAAAAQKLLQAAQLQAEAADSARTKWAADIAEDAERVESGKAAAAAGLGGLAATLPLVLSDGSGAGAALLALAAAGVASALLGVTYRYAVRQDLGNFQLKAGVVAAFGLVRGLGQATGILAAAPGGAAESFAGLDLSVQALGSSGLALGQCMLAAAFAATAVEVGMQRGLVKPFGAAGGDGENAAAGSSN